MTTLYGLKTTEYAAETRSTVTFVGTRIYVQIYIHADICFEFALDLLITFYLTTKYVYYERLEGGTNHNVHACKQVRALFVVRIVNLIFSFNIYWTTRLFSVKKKIRIYEK